MPPRWVWFAVFGPLALCLACGTLGYFVAWPRVADAIDDQREQVSREVADSLRLSLTSSLLDVPADAEQVRFDGRDLDINNVIVFSSEDEALSGIETGTDGTSIYGFVTRITPDRIALLSGEEVVYSGVPAVEDGQIVMTQVEASDAFMAMLLTGDGFADAFESGINDALASHGLCPTAVALSFGTMVI